MTTGKLCARSENEFDVSLRYWEMLRVCQSQSTETDPLLEAKTRATTQHQWGTASAGIAYDGC